MYKNPFAECILKSIEEFEQQSTPYWMRSAIYSKIVRHPLVRRFSWAIPDDNAINKIHNFSNRIVEIGAGNGYWAYMLNHNLKTEIVCYDLDPPTDHDSEFMDEGIYYKILKGSHEVLENYDTNYTLLLCWPPWDNPMAVECLRAFKGTKVIYIGEPRGGCTGTDDFFDELEDKWELHDNVYIPNFEGMNDELYFYVRKK